MWVHALSVGETMAAWPLVRAFKRHFPGKSIIFSTSTEKGQDTARTKLSQFVDDFFYLPHDFHWAVENIVESLSPALFITIETDVWPNLLHSLRKKNIPSFLVNGRISPRSLLRFQKIKRFAKDLFNYFDACLMQSSVDGEKLLELGVDPERIVVTGNLKFDTLSELMTQVERKSQPGLSLTGDDVASLGHGPIWVAGSTHAGEEDLLLGAFIKLHKKFPELFFIIVPRYIEEAPSIAKKASSLGLKAVLRSKIESLDSCLSTHDVLVVDSMGELAGLYSLASVAFIGGSLVAAGGHNPLEAAARGIPVLFGPHMFNFREVEELLLQELCAAKVLDERSLATEMEKLLGNRHRRKAMGDRGKELCRKQMGVAERIVDILTPYLATR